MVKTIRPSPRPRIYNLLVNNAHCVQPPYRYIASMVPIPPHQSTWDIGVSVDDARAFVKTNKTAFEFTHEWAAANASPEEADQLYAMVAAAQWEMRHDLRLAEGADVAKIVEGM